MKKWIFTALAVSALVLPAAAFAGKDHPFITFGTGKDLLDEKAKQARSRTTSASTAASTPPSLPPHRS